MHNAALAASALEGVYIRWRADEEGMREAASRMRNGTLHGANITMPHKGLAAVLADRLSTDADRAQSVNTWVVDKAGRINGHSTDVEGVRRAWERARLPHDVPVLVIGAGGAAAAAIVALEGLDLWCSARRAESVSVLVDRVDIPLCALGWGESLPGSVVVNATPLGMRGGDLPHALLADAAGLFDMAYLSDRADTAAVRRMRAQGRPVADGLSMLVAQAEASFQLWTGRLPPEGVMEGAVRGEPPGGG